MKGGKCTFELPLLAIGKSSVFHYGGLCIDGAAYTTWQLVYPRVSDMEREKDRKPKMEVTIFS